MVNWGVVKLGAWLNLGRGVVKVRTNVKNNKGRVCIGTMVKLGVKRIG